MERYLTHFTETHEGPKPDNSALFYVPPILPEGVKEVFQTRIPVDPKNDPDLEYGVTDWCPIPDSTWW